MNENGELCLKQDGCSSVVGDIVCKLKSRPALSSMNSLLISAFVKEERKNQNLTQEELAEKSGISVRTIGSIEDNKSVRKSSIEKVVETLGFRLVVRYDFEKIEK